MFNPISTRGGGGFRTFFQTFLHYSETSEANKLKYYDLSRNIYTKMF